MDLSEIILRVKYFIDSEIKIELHKPLLIGLSGGADSVALLDILVALGYDCVACHCNFQLRGDEAERDMNFARSIANELNVPFRYIRFNTIEYASVKHISIEMACRELRYEWFEEQRKENDAMAIAVAHHRDDSVETVLLNLIRGTGISGLTGIHAVNGHVIRPLLCLSRKEIEMYLSFRHLAYITDSTNKEDVYLRNKIRLQVLPLLAGINPSIYETLERTASNLYEVEQLYRCALNMYISKISEMRGKEFYISIQKLLESPAPRTLLFEIVKPFGFLPIQLDDILKTATGIPGKYFVSSTHFLLKDRDYFIIKEKSFEGSDIVIVPETAEKLFYPVKLTISKKTKTPDYIISKHPFIAAFDADKISFPLIVRPWKEGDRFVPFGMKGSRKLSDYFRDKKFTLYQKQAAYVLVSGNEIIWLIGERISDKFKISEKTDRILEIKCEK
ncbi:tRNA lysidine(34) synthetase TilS [Coprobacter sp.]